MHRLIKPTDLARIKNYLNEPDADGNQTGYPDECQILQYSAGTRDTHNQPKRVYTPYGPHQNCRIRPVTGSSEAMDLAQVPIATDVFHLPLSATYVPVVNDRVVIYSRWDTAVSVPQTFDIVGNVEQNAVEYTAMLKLVTNA